MYWKVCEDTYLQNPQGRHQQSIFDALVALYSHIIEYQARAICFLSGAQLKRAWQSVAGWNHWTENATSVGTLSERSKEFLPLSQVKAAQENWCRQLQEMKESRAILDTIRAAVDGSTKTLLNIYEDQKETSLLHDLTSDYEGHKNFNREKAPNTCEWFLKDDGFRRWRDSATSALLWMSAGPGCGKSVLARSLIDRGQLSTTITTSTVCYFFFKDGVEHRMDASDALAAILHQLFTQDVTGSLIQHAIPSHKQHGPALKQNFSELWRILTKCLDDEAAGEVICLLDALDECNQNGKALMENLRDFYVREHEPSASSQLKFIITSRPYLNLETVFGTFSKTPKYIHLDGDDKSDEISKDIDLVIDDMMPVIAGGLTAEDRLQISQRLKKMDNRTYLWLHLTFDIIKERQSRYSRRKDIEALLSDLPKEVAGAYEQILNRSPDPTRTEVILELVLAATKPLTLDEANYALVLAFEEGRLPSHAKLDLYPRQSFKGVVKDLCGLFINVFHDRLFFLHQTAREFLLAQDDSPNKWQGRLTLQKSHNRLSLCCLRYLHLPELAEEDEPELMEYPFLSYAAENWPAHFASQGKTLGIKSVRDACSLCEVDGPRTRMWIKSTSGTVARFILWLESDLVLASYLGLAVVVDDILSHADRSNIGRSYVRSLSAAILHDKREVVEVLLRKSEEAIVAEEAVIAAANESSEAVMMLLLKQWGQEVKITEEVVKTAAGNWASGEAVMRLLLEQRGEEVKITEDVVRAAAGNEVISEEVMRLLLEQRGEEVKITEEVVKAVTRNAFGEEVMRLLLKQRGEEVKITEEVVKAAAGNEESGEAVMRLLLEQRGEEVKITEEVVKVAVGNWGSGKAVMRLFRLPFGQEEICSLDTMDLDP